MRDEFFIEKQGRRMVLYAGLIDEAHQRGLSYIETQLLQIPNQDNGMVAICKAWVEVNEVDAATGLAVTDADGVAATIKTTGIGDASPENVGRNIAPHIIRMAETRAKARALRDAVNVGVTAAEEMGEEETSSSASQSAQASPGERKRTPGGATEKAAEFLVALMVEKDSADEEKARERVYKLNAGRVSKGIEHYQNPEGAQG